MQFQTKSYRITMLDDLIGTMPKDPDIFETFLLKKMEEEKNEKPAMPKSKIEETKIEELVTLPKTNQPIDEMPLNTVDEKGITGFHSDENGLFIYNYVFRGFLKNASNVLKTQADVAVKNFKSKVENYVFIAPRRLYLMRDGKHIKSIDGHYIRPILANDRFGGKRVFIGKSEKVKAGCQIDVTINIVVQSDFGFQHLENIMEYGRFCGLGQARNNSYGTFSFEPIGKKPEPEAKQKAMKINKTKKQNIVDTEIE